MLSSNHSWLALLLATTVLQSTSAAQSAPFELGVRGLILLGKGTPANDMIGQGLIGSFPVGDKWRLGLALDNVTFDYETPNRTLGIQAASVVDGTNEWQRISAFVERRFDGERRWDWHWLAGFGRADVDEVKNVGGVRVGGGTFDIATDADTELHVFAGGGAHRTLGSRWLLDASLTVEHQDTDYQLVDRVSGVRGAIGSHSAYGISIGIAYRF